MNEENSLVVIILMRHDQIMMKVNKCVSIALDCSVSLVGCQNCHPTAQWININLYLHLLLCWFLYSQTFGVMFKGGKQYSVFLFHPKTLRQSAVWQIFTTRVVFIQHKAILTIVNWCYEKILAWLVFWGKMNAGKI